MGRPAYDTRRKPKILLIEDNDADALLTREAFDKASVDVNIYRAANGEEGMAFLHHEGHYTDAPTPDLVLLDINMPRMGGRDVLRAISMDNELRHLPVVILTTSSREEDILDMYRLRCSSYVIKPLDFEGFVTAIRDLNLYWFNLVARPSS